MFIFLTNKKIIFILDFNTWIVSYKTEDQPIEYFIYNRLKKKSDFLFSSRPELYNQKLNRMIGFDYAASDGLRIKAYLSLPLKV